MHSVRLYATFENFGSARSIKLRTTRKKTCTRIVQNYSLLVLEIIGFAGFKPSPDFFTCHVAHINTLAAWGSGFDLREKFAFSKVTFILVNSN